MSIPALPRTAANYPELYAARQACLERARVLFPGLDDRAALEAFADYRDPTPPLVPAPPTQRYFPYVKDDKVKSIFGVPLTLRTDPFYDKHDITIQVVVGTLLFAVAIILAVGILIGVLI